MMRKTYILALLVCFLGLSYLLNSIGFWSRIGLSTPVGFEAMGILFCALLFVLSKFLFEPFLKIMEERENQTIGKKQKADETRKSAEEIFAEYQSKIEHTRLEAIRERERMAIEAEKAEQEILTVARAEGSEAFTKSLEVLQREADVAAAEIKGEIPKLAQEMVEQVLALPARAKKFTANTTQPATKRG